MKEKVIVVGDDGINSLGLIRSLGEAGIRSDALITDSGSKKVHLLKSRYLNKGYVVPKDEDILFESLQAYGKKNGTTYLFPTSDFVLNVIGKHSEDLKRYYVLPSVSDKIGSLSDILSKEKMAYYAEKAGFVIPKMQKCHIDISGCVPSEIVSCFADEYPLILKSDSILVSGCDFKIVYDEKELVDFLHKCADRTVIIQKYITDAQELAVQCVGFGQNRKAEAYGVIKKIRTSVFAMGTTTYAELTSFDNQILKNLCCIFAELLDYSGLYDLDILVKDQKLYFIECNFRNGSNGYAYTKAGCNLAYLWLSNFTNQESKASNNLQCQFHAITFINDVGDFAHVLRRDIPPFTWLKQYSVADCRLLFNFRDQMPFFAEIIDIVCKRITGV